MTSTKNFFLLFSALRTLALLYTFLFLFGHIKITRVTDAHVNHFRCISRIPNIPQISLFSNSIPVYYISELFGVA
jgi:hypothetical protein